MSVRQPAATQALTNSPLSDRVAQILSFEADQIHQLLHQRQHVIHVHRILHSSDSREQ